MDKIISSLLLISRLIDAQSESNIYFFHFIFWFNIYIYTSLTHEDGKQAIQGSMHTLRQVIRYD